MTASANTTTTDGAKAPSRSGASMRQAMMDHPRAKIVSETFELFGQQVELRQASLEGIITARDFAQLDGRNAAAVARALVENTYVPGTNERVFQEEDVEWILSLPFGEDLIRASTALNRLMGVDFLQQNANSGGTPGVSP